MPPKLCAHCNKRFSSKSDLIQHSKTDCNQLPPFYGGLRQNGVLSQASQAKFENADNQVSSQVDDRSTNVGSDGYYGELSESDDGKPRDLNDFWLLEMSKQMTEWNSAKLRLYTPSVFFILTLISRALSRDNILKSIMKTAKRFRDTRGIRDYEAVERAVSEKQCEIRDKLELSGKEPESSDSEEEREEWDTDTEWIDTEWPFDIWEFINNILDGEDVSGSTRTKRGVELVLFYMRNAEAWRRDHIYRGILKIVKRKRVELSFQEGLKYAIGQWEFDILLHFEHPFAFDDDESESEQCVYFYDLKRRGWFQ